MTGANSQTAYRQCVEAGPDATLQKVLKIYRNEAAVQAHFQTRQHSQSLVHQINAQYPTLKEREEEDVHKLHNPQKRRYNQSAKAPSPEREEAESTLAEDVTGAETVTSHKNVQHMVRNVYIAVS